MGESLVILPRLRLRKVCITPDVNARRREDLDNH